jgi:hypothetical protein
LPVSLARHAGAGICLTHFPRTWMKVPDNLDSHGFMVNKPLLLTLTIKGQNRDYVQEVRVEIAECAIFDV